MTYSRKLNRNVELHLNAWMRIHERLAEGPYQGDGKIFVADVKEACTIRTGKNRL